MARLHVQTVRASDDDGSTEREGDAPPVLRLLHGIYGRGRNWRRFARRFVETRPGWAAELVDLREHGASRGFEPPHTVQATASDVVEAGPSPRLLLGHSFGGKIALLTLRHDGFRPEQVWVVDASPGARAPSGLPWEMIAVLRAHPGPFETRDEGVRALESEGVPTPVARWMATNLDRSEGGDGSEGSDDLLRWRISADTMESLLRSYFAEDAWDVVEGADDTAVHVVRASRSDVLGSDDVERLRAATGDANVHLHEVEGGHWLHTENPEGLLAAMEEATA